MDNNSEHSGPICLSSPGSSSNYERSPSQPLSLEDYQESAGDPVSDQETLSEDNLGNLG